MRPSRLKLCGFWRTLFLWVALGSVLAPSASAVEKPSALLLISIDGYRHDYTKRYKPPHLTQFLSRRSSQASSLIPVFPSLTFPNHYSIVTGLYAEHHGLVANRFYNRETDKTFSITDAQAANEGSWYGGTPLWVLAEQQGVKSACIFWPGSAALIQNKRPTYYKAYDPAITNRQRIEHILTWLQLPAAERPRFLTLYFSDVDTAGHRFGPDSPQVAAAITRVDTELAYLFSQLAKLRPLDKLNINLNIAIVSDHGMQGIGAGHLIHLADLIKLSPGIRIAGDGAFSMLYIKDMNERQTVYKALKRQPALNVYFRNEIPQRLHYRSDKNIGDIVISVKAPYFLVTEAGKKEALRGGDHGYDPATTPSMRGIFYASGPNIKPGVNLESVENIHLFPLFTNILGLKMPSNLDAQPVVSKALYQKTP